MKNVLSILSKIPPWPGIKFEKSLIKRFLLINEKYISPKKNEMEIKNDAISEKSKYKDKKNDNIIEDKVPDQVLFGLTFGVIKGPLIRFPKI